MRCALPSQMNSVNVFDQQVQIDGFNLNDAVTDMLQTKQEECSSGADASFSTLFTMDVVENPEGATKGSLRIVGNCFKATYNAISMKETCNIYVVALQA
jgi:hypothetical protein